MPEQGLHADAEVLVVAVDGGPDLRFASHAGAADPGEDRRDDVVAEGEEGSDGAGGLRRDVVAACPAGFAGEALSAEFPEVIGSLPGGVAVVPDEVADLGGEAGDGESARAGASASAAVRAARILGLFRSIPAIRLVPACAGSGSSSSTPSGRNPISAQSRVVANRSAMPASQADDLGEVLQAAAAAEFFGVMHGGLQAQDVLALGAGLQLESPEADPEPAEPVPWLLDHDFLRGRA